MSTPEIHFRDNQHIGVVVPRTLVDAIDRYARQELISRSTWVRRIILNAVHAQATAAHDGCSERAILTGEPV